MDPAEVCRGMGGGWWSGGSSTSAGSAGEEGASSFSLLHCDPPWVAPLCVLLGFLHPNSPSSASWGRIRGNISPLPYPQSSQPMLEGSPSAAGRARHELGCLAHHKHCPKKATKAPLCSQTAQHIHTAHPTALGLGMDWLGWLYWHSPSVRAGSTLGLTGAPSTELLLALVSS